MQSDNLEEQIIFDKLTGKLQIHAHKKIKAPKVARPLESFRVPELSSVVMDRYIAELEQQITSMEATRVNTSARPIFSNRKYLREIIVFCKRAIRRCLKWYVEPICNQQTDFNNAATIAIGRLAELQSIFWKQLEEQNARLEEQNGFGSTSQSGEDMILAYIFMMLGFKKQECSYLDLGANHPVKFSNTYHFYQHGARGVLVEANPKLIPELQRYRAHDVILNRCISEKSGQHVDFYILNGDGLSAPNKEQIDEVIARNPALKVEDVVTVETITVNEIFDTYFEKTPLFLNIDIEGDEIKILESIDFTRHRPLAISIETIPYRLHLVVGLKRQEIVDFMKEKDYVEYAFSGINSIFLDKHQVERCLE